MTCLFIDGLDEFNEFDRINDADNLLGLIEEFSTNNKIKTCVSSRPEDYLVKQLSKYRQLQLQDLTREDLSFMFEIS